MPCLLRIRSRNGKWPLLAFSIMGDRAEAASEHVAAFGRHLRTLRRRSGLTQEALAHEAGLHRAVVGFIERGERDIGISTLWPLARALQVEVADLFPSASGAGADGR